MSWLSKKWDQLSGKNQKISQNTIKGEYEDAFGGARKTYGALEERGMDMMDPNSQFNLQQKERMEGSAADAAAMSSRMAGRNAAMSGGANAASLAAQTASGANQAQAGAIGAYNQYLSGAMSQGAGMASGAANNMAQMNQTQMNALQANRQANRQIDSQATAFNANMLGKGLNKIFQEGGAVDFEPHLMYKGDVKKMANTYKEHLALKKSGYSHQREMAKGGFLSKLLRAEKEMMPSQEEIEDMKYGDGNDNYHYRDMRRPMHRIDRDPDMLPLPASIDDSAPRVRGDDESYIPAEDTRLQSDGTLRNERMENLELMRQAVRWEDMNKGPEPKNSRQLPPQKQKGGYMKYQSGGYAESPYGNSGGMLSQVAGPDGMPMNIRTRIGGQLVGE